jgi:uncharacterized protein
VVFWDIRWYFVVGHTETSAWMAQDTIVQETTPVQSRDEVIARLRAHEAEIRGFGATALYLFGSVARDELTAESDVDIFIDVASNDAPSLVQLSQLMRRLAAQLGRLVEVTTREGLHPVLRSEIEDTAIVVF